MGVALGSALAAWGGDDPADRAASERAAENRAAQSGAWLGVFLGDALDGGVEVIALVPGGPAQKAGLREGDLILEVGGEPAPHQAALGRLVESRQPGDTVDISILRAGQSLSVPIELGRRAGRSFPFAWRLPSPPAPTEPADIPHRYRLQSRLPRILYGLQVAEMTPALREHFGAPRDAGVLVLGIDAAEPAAKAGFQVGDVLVQLDGRNIRDEDQLTWTISSWNEDHPLVARVSRGGEPVVIELRPSASRSLDRVAPDAPRAGRDAERTLLERRIRTEIERLEERLRALREELARLQEDR